MRPSIIIVSALLALGASTAGAQQGEVAASSSTDKLFDFNPHFNIGPREAALAPPQLGLRLNAVSAERELSVPEVRLRINTASAVRELATPDLNVHLNRPLFPGR